MSATDELRRMLDEIGVEWRNNGCSETEWHSSSGILIKALQRSDRSTFYLRAYGVTPGQAIAATLGPCEVWLLMATDVDDGREKVLGVYATKDAAEAAVDENRCGYALHDVQRWEVDA